MKRSGDSIHRCRSPTPTLNGCDLTPSTRTQSSEQEYSYLTASKRHPSTPHSRNTPQSFSRGTRPYTFPRSTKHVYKSLACSQNFSKFCWRVEICSVVLRPRQKPHWISPNFGSIIFPSWHTRFLGGLAKRSPGSWSIHPCLPFCVSGRSICWSFGTLPKRHATWHTRISQTIQRSKFPNSLSNFSQLTLSSDLSGIRELIDAQFYGCFHLCKIKIYRLKNFAQFCQMRCQCWQKESTMLKFFVFISRSKTTHIASFLFSDSCFSAA